MSKRHAYFCLEEANALVPSLEFAFTQLALVRRRMQDLHASLQKAGASVNPQGIEMPEGHDASAAELCEQYFSQCQAYDTIIDDVTSWGVEILDDEVGIVVFYSWWDNEEVVLSWQFGENTVQFWHDPGEAFTERRPIRQLFFDAPLGDLQRH